MKRISPLVIALLLASCATQAPPPPQPSQPVAPAPAPTTPVAAVPTGPVADLAAARAQFARETAAKYQLDEAWIAGVLANAQIKDAIITAMSRPAEGKQWREYRPIFMTAGRIGGGQTFMTNNAAALAAAEARYGVPKEIITAIIGVETGYGANKGSWNVVDALYTLAFRYPRTNEPAKIARENMREAFFRDELAQVFALSREAKLDVTSLKGSYAGAMGWGQFMPSSYRLWSVDGNGDGRKDLLNDVNDAIPSVANYFIGRGKWQPGAPVMVRALRSPGGAAYNPDNRPDINSTVGQLAQMGYKPTQSFPDNTPASIITLQGANGEEVWMIFGNFKAITEYNKSPLYATAVYQLSQEIAGRPVPGA